MQEFSSQQLSQAHRALLSTLKKCEKIDQAGLGKSQQTLLTRRMEALRLALVLIERQLRQQQEECEP